MRHAQAKGRAIKLHLSTNTKNDTVPTISPVHGKPVEVPTQAVYPDFTMKKYNCPSCGAEVLFRSVVSVYAVCQFCRSIVVRRDVDVESIGTMAALPDDMSPLQIGTEGDYQQHQFTLIGRRKMGWRDGGWNEWLFITDDGRNGWLAEAQGSYGISFELDYPLYPVAGEAHSGRITRFEKMDPIHRVAKRKVLSDASLEVGSYVTLDEQSYRVMDVKHATCIGNEGEMPFMIPQGRKTLTFDLLGRYGEFASIEILDSKLRFYVGHYVEWDDLHCRNLRPLEGW